MFTTEVKINSIWVEVDSSDKIIDVIHTAQMFIATHGIEFVRVKKDDNVIVVD